MPPSLRVRGSSWSRGLRTIVGTALAVTLLASIGASSTLANDPRELLIADSFDRANAAGWGDPDQGDRWMYPTGRGGITLVSGRGAMDLRRRGVPHQTTVNTSVRDVTMQFTFSLDRMPGGSGTKVVAVVRKSVAGEYRLGVRIGREGRVWLSVAKSRSGGAPSSMGDPVAIEGWRYRAGEQIRVRIQAIKQNPAQLRMKAWLAGSARPSRWQLVRDDSRNDVGAGGRIGLRSVLTDGATNAPVRVRFDDLKVNRAQDATRVPTTDPGVDQPKADPKPTSEPSGLKLPSTIDATGSKDVSSRLQSFINDAPNGSSIVFKAGGTYRLDSVIRIRGKRNLTLEGNGARLDLKGTSGRYDSIGIIIENASVGTTIRGLTMVGNNSEAGTSAVCCGREAQHAIAVLSATDTLIEDVDIRRVWGDCVYVNAQAGGAWSDGVTFRDSTCKLSGRHGVGIIAGKDIRIANNVFDQIGFMVVDIEPNTSDGGAIDVVIKDNTIGSYGLTDQWVSWLLAAVGKEGSVVRNVTVTGNTVEGNKAGYDGKVLGLNLRIDGNRGPREDFTVTNNTAKTTTRGPVMYFTQTDGVTVTGNSQPLSSGELASFSGSTGVTYRP